MNVLISGAGIAGPTLAFGSGNTDLRRSWWRPRLLCEPAAMWCEGLFEISVPRRARSQFSSFDRVARTSDNEHMVERARKRLRKRAKRGLRGYPVATVALYGPDDITATKLAVGIVPAEDAGVADLRRWFSEGTDIRNDASVAEEVLAFIDAAGAKSIVMTDRIIGCPHEEGLDYEGPTCPSCPFWAGRDRWTGRRLH